MKRRSLSQCKFSFFGLTQEHRVQIFKQIHEIVFWGRGGYVWETIYNMPIWLRNATFRFVEGSIDQENESYKKASNGTSSSNGTSNTNLDWANPDKSQINLPSHITKASKR